MSHVGPSATTPTWLEVSAYGSLGLLLHSICAEIKKRWALYMSMCTSDSVSGGFWWPERSEQSFQRCAEAVQKKEQPDWAVCCQKGELGRGGRGVFINIWKPTLWVILIWFSSTGRKIEKDIPHKRPMHPGSDWSSVSVESSSELLLF